jgi:hypothetical protein
MKTLQFKRYTTSEMASVTGASGELIVDLTKKSLTVHDGVQAGGFALAKEIHTHDASSVFLPGTYVPLGNLGSGTPSSSTYLRGDGTWATISSSGGGTTVSIVSDNSTNTWMYPTLSGVTSGTISELRIGNSYLRYNPSQGSLEAFAFNAVSDAREKENVVQIPYGLDTVLAMNPVAFNYIDTGVASIGLIAQEVVGLVPEVVGGDEDRLSVNYPALVAVLIKAIQQLEARVSELEGA